MEVGKSCLVVLDAPDTFDIGGGSNEQSRLEHTVGNGRLSGQQSDVDITRRVRGEPWLERRLLS